MRRCAPTRERPRAGAGRRGSRPASCAAATAAASTRRAATRVRGFCRAGRGGAAAPDTVDGEELELLTVGQPFGPRAWGDGPVGIERTRPNAVAQPSVTGATYSFTRGGHGPTRRRGHAVPLRAPGRGRNSGRTTCRCAGWSRARPGARSAGRTSVVRARGIRGRRRVRRVRRCRVRPCRARRCRFVVVRPGGFDADRFWVVRFGAVRFGVVRFARDEQVRREQRVRAPTALLAEPSLFRLLHPAPFSVDDAPDGAGHLADQVLAGRSAHRGVQAAPDLAGRRPVDPAGVVGDRLDQVGVVAEERGGVHGRCDDAGEGGVVPEVVADLDAAAVGEDDRAAQPLDGPAARPVERVDPSFVASPVGLARGAGCQQRADRRLPQARVGAARGGVRRERRTHLVLLEGSLQVDPARPGGSGTGSAAGRVSRAAAPRATISTKVTTAESRSVRAPSGTARAVPSAVRRGRGRTPAPARAPLPGPRRVGRAGRRPGSATTRAGRPGCGRRAGRSAGPRPRPVARAAPRHPAGSPPSPAGVTPRVNAGFAGRRAAELGDHPTERGAHRSGEQARRRADELAARQGARRAVDVDRPEEPEEAVHRAAVVGPVGQLGQLVDDGPGGRRQVRDGDRLAEHEAAGVVADPARHGEQGVDVRGRRRRPQLLDPRLARVGQHGEHGPAQHQALPAIRSPCAAAVGGARRRR